MGPFAYEEGWGSFCSGAIRKSAARYEREGSLAPASKGGLATIPAG